MECELEFEEMYVVILQGWGCLEWWDVGRFLRKSIDFTAA